MIIIWGNGLYGKVDHVPGLFYVASRFGHLYYIPLIPTESVLILDGSETSEGYRGVSIGLSFKSILFAWLRVALLLFGVYGAVAGVIHLFMLFGGHPNANHWTAAQSIAFAVVGFGMLYASYRFSKASPHRALELGKRLGLEPEQIAAFFVNHPAVPQEGEPGNTEQHHS
jgi:hypothetical protein